MKTLNQMEKEDVPAHVIEEYKKAEILRKSMAVVKKHAQKIEDIRTSPDRYDKVKGKINTQNPFAVNLSTVGDHTKRTFGSTITHPASQTNNINKRGDNLQTTAKSGNKTRGTAAPSAAGPQLANNQNQNNDSEEWYRPELGDIPYAPLTKEKRAKIEARDQEIAQKEQELDQILQNINARKRERAEKEQKARADETAALGGGSKKKKKKVAKGNKKGTTAGVAETEQ